MTGLNATILLLSLLTAGIVGVGVWRALRVWRRFHGVRLVTCPATGRPEAIEIDARRAAFTSLVEDEPTRQLASCSRWPAHGACKQECLPQVEAGGEDTTVNALVHRWCGGKPCRFCGRPITEVSFLDHRAAFSDPAGTTFEWSAIPPERLPDVMRSHTAVCWNCHVAETFRRQYPDLVIDRDVPVHDPARLTVH